MPRTTRERAGTLARSGRPNGSDRLGPRLRGAREKAGMSVRGLARKIGVSASLVSQIEHGHVMPSVGTLYAMANELGLLVDDLFRDEDTAPPPDRPARGLATLGPVQRSRGRETIHLSGGVRWERLTPTSDAEVEFLYVVYDVGATSCEKDALIRHGGKEYAYVLSGRLGIQVGFEEFELRPGDSISFDAQNPHRLWTIGKRPAVAVWVVLNRHGDRRRRKRA
jgi:DNA-binding XRE family transcriptional regulator/quercetin dioxygenase-like cupin family protein